MRISDWSSDVCSSDLQAERHDVEQLSDIMAFRLVVADVAACYHALGLIHARYPVVPGRFKDYISTPKNNGYRSLHTGVIGQQRQRIEMQTRSAAMHRVSELGVAAHWSSKDRKRVVQGKRVSVRVEPR